MKAERRLILRQNRIGQVHNKAEAEIKEEK
jgi:hypothetical protein